MPEIRRIAVGLRVAGAKGSSLDHAGITSLLGQPPTVDPASPDGVGERKTSPVRHTAPHVWLRSHPRDKAGDLDAQIREMLESLTQDLAVWKSLAGRFRMDMNCGLFMGETNEGLTLQPDTLHALGARGISLGFDIYGPPDRQAALETCQVAG